MKTKSKKFWKKKDKRKEENMDIEDILDIKKINTNLKSQEKEQIIYELSKLLEENEDIGDIQSFVKDVMERERISSTGIGNGVAIPHGKSPAVKKTAVAIGVVCNTCTNWETFDKQPVKIVILLAVNDKDKDSVHVKLLSQMARKLAKKSVCDRLCSAKTAQQIIDVFKNDNQEE